jgi:hypothetical protein
MMNESTKGFEKGFGAACWFPVSRGQEFLPNGRTDGKLYEEG